jgi:hypothetical protein
MRGRVMGPFGPQQLKSLRDRGQLGRFHELSEDRQSWVPAASVTELFPPAGEIEMIANPGVQPLGAVLRPQSGIRAGMAASGDVREWYYMDGQDQQHGPLSLGQLESLRIAEDITDPTLVWKQGMEDWTPFSFLGLVLAPRGGRSAGDAAGAARPFSPTETARAVETVLGWRRVRSGLTLVLVALFVAIAGGVLAAYGILIGITDDGRAGASTVAFTLLFVGMIGFVSQLVETVGFGFCAACPPESGAKGLGATVLVLAVANPVLTLLIMIFVFAAGVMTLEGDYRGARATGGMLGALQFLNWLIILAKPFIFLLFLRAVALRLRIRRLAQGIQHLTLLYGLTVLLSFFFVLMSFMSQVFFSPREDRQTMVAHLSLLLAFGIVLLCLWLAWLVWYMVILFQSRRAVEHHLQRG